MLSVKQKEKNKKFPKIIFEDEDFFVFDKPPSWIVDDSKSTKGRDVIESWLRENFDYEIAKNKEERSGVVHRLDKETSGILLVAKNTKTLKDLQSQFKGRMVEKTYTALAHGEVFLKKGTIKVPVGRLPWNRERFGVLPGGKKATTDYKVTNYYQKDGEKFSLLSLTPQTGRTHQIRIHLKHLGNPVVSDEFYAGRKTAKKDRAWCPRLFLHALEISFTHPTTKKRVVFKSKLPRDLVEALEKLS